MLFRSHARTRETYPAGQPDDAPAEQPDDAPAEQPDNAPDGSDASSEQGSAVMGFGGDDDDYGGEMEDLPEEQIKELAQNVDAFIMAEMNLGQLVYEVQRHVNQPVEGVFHAGGAMMPPDPILDTIKEVSSRGNGRYRG